MPRKTTITWKKVGGAYRIIVPLDIRGIIGQRTIWKKTKEDAKNKCAELMNQRGEMGARFHQLDKVGQAKVIQAYDLAGSPDALLGHVRQSLAIQPKEQATLKELAIRTVDAKQRAGKTDYYCDCLRRSLMLFIGTREAELAHTIQPHHIDTFINSNATWTPFTKRTYLRDITTMFSFGVKNGLCVDNPALKVERPTLLDTAPMILTAPDCERLMRAAEAKDPALVQYLALCLFAGLRPSEAMRIMPENMKLDHVEVFGKKVRARNRRLVPINETLFAWLLRYPGDFEPVNLRRRLVAIRKATKTEAEPEIRWTQDCLRHTFVSMYYAIHGAKETAQVAGHSETVLFQHYRELVTRQSAIQFWSIRPKT